MSMYKMQNVFIPLTLHSQGKVYECRTQNAECRTGFIPLRYTHKEKLNAECGARNYPTTLRSVHKERLYKCGTRSAERPCLSAECGMRNAERLCSAKATQTRKDYISAERGARNTERLCSAKATQTRKDYISAERGARSTERPHSAYAPLTRKSSYN